MSWIYKRPSRHGQDKNTIDILSVLPSHVLAGYPDPSGLAEAAQQALNCCRSCSRKGLLTIGDENGRLVPAIMVNGKTKFKQSLSALTYWMDVDDAWAFLVGHSGMPVSGNAWKAMNTF